MTTIQNIPEQSPRVESGVVQFGNDWPGIFIRGDRAMYLAACLKHQNPSFLELGSIKGLADLLGSCDVEKLRE